jgi:hypothetical protein
MRGAEFIPSQDLNAPNVEVKIGSKRICPRTLKREMTSIPSQARGDEITLLQRNSLVGARSIDRPIAAEAR